MHYGEDLMVGYRHYDTNKVEPRFAFGHGLSYSKFEYRDLRLGSSSISCGDSVRVEVEVANVGQRRASDVVQVYVHDEESRLARPEQELRAFKKVELDPGASTVVSFDLDQRAMAYYDPEASDWAVDPGTFEIRVGASSRDIRARASLEVTDI